MSDLSVFYSSDLYRSDEFLDMTFPEGVRCELHDGFIYMMASPTVRHQSLLKMINMKFDAYFMNKSCNNYTSPLDVVLSEYVTYQPDLFVVCDKGKINIDGHIRGSPDLVVEIISPSSKKIDVHDKRTNYEKYGVKEYWVVYSEYTVLKCILINGRYEETLYRKVELPNTICSSIFPDLEVRLDMVTV